MGNQGEGKVKPLFRECCQVNPGGSPEVLETQWTLSSSTQKGLEIIIINFLRLGLTCFPWSHGLQPK